MGSCAILGREADAKELGYAPEGVGRGVSPQVPPHGWHNFIASAQCSCAGKLPYPLPRNPAFRKGRFQQASGQRFV
jgi:hypothetical protein